MRSLLVLPVVLSTAGIAVAAAAPSPELDLDLGIGIGIDNAGPPLLRRAAGLTSPNDPQQTGTVSNCNLWYDIVTNDTCESVAAKFGITEAQFLAWNPAINSDCSVNFWVNYAYCVGVSSSSSEPTTTTPAGTATAASSASSSTPPLQTFTGMPCNCDKYYVIVSGDTCPSVEAKFGITSDQFHQWNPAVSSDCSVNFWINYTYCVGISGSAVSTVCPTTNAKTQTGTTSAAAQTTSVRPSTTSSHATTALPTPPSPTFPGIPCTCDEFYEVIPGDSCESIQTRFGITAADFLEWNPSISANCTLNFYNGYSYCVSVSSGTACVNNSPPPQTSPSNALPYSYISSGATPSWGPRPTASGWPPQPTQSGIPSNCQQYYQANPMDTCVSIQHRFSGQMTMDEFLDWNPAVGANCTSLYVNYYYCVMVPVAYTALPNATTQYPFTITSTGVPTTTWNLTSLWDLQTTFPGAATACPILFPIPDNSTTCNDIVDIVSNLTITEFEDWNTGVNCSSLTPDELYCIANPSSPLPPPAPVPTSGTGPQPQQPGLVSDCSNFWFVGTTDNCTTIAAANNITETQLEGWNPALGSDCSGLKPSYFVCIGVPGNITIDVPSTTGTAAAATTAQSTSAGSSSASSTGPTGPTTATQTSATQVTTASSQTATWSTPTPTQSGMAADCSWFYLVPTGTSCYNIAQEAEMTLDTLYALNPGLENCDALIPGYYICLATGGSAARTQTSGTPVGPTPLPIQTGVSSACTRYYLVESGNSCNQIADEAGVSISSFYSWNPAVGSSCTDLQPGFYVCIGTTGPSTTITSGDPVPAPTS